MMNATHYTCLATASMVKWGEATRAEYMLFEQRGFVQAQGAACWAVSHAMLSAVLATPLLSPCVNRDSDRQDKFVALSASPIGAS
eukprot:3287928-Rhodomonas_salina.1